MEEIKEEMPGEPLTESSQPLELEPEKRDVWRTIAIVAAVLLFVALIVAAGYGLVTNPDLTEVLRDISIIVLALVTIIIGAFLIILVYQLQSLTVLLRDEIKPILNSANQTANTVRGTTTFVSDTIVRPAINAWSYAAGARQTLWVLFGFGRRKRRRERQVQQPRPAAPPPSSQPEETP
ncbi:MAG: hypothetical protein PVJ23_00460 [Anaerolineae bacterium]|jgi:hypothetical protein